MPADAHTAPAGSVTPPLGAAYRRLWASSGMSNLADGIFKVALPLVAIRFTRSPTLIAGLTLALTLPWLLFALPAGALADRLDRRRAMLGANTVRAAVLVAIAGAVVGDAASIALLYVLAFAVGMAETIYDTSAQSILPQMVGRAALSRANARLYAAELTANQFLGPPVGGFLVAAGAALAFIAPAGLWLLAAGVLLLVPGAFRVGRDERTTLRADIAEGVRFLGQHRLLRTLAGMVGVFNFCSNASMTMLVLFAVGPSSPMGLSEPAYGVLLATLAVGSLLGSVVAERVERLLGRAGAMVLAVVGFAMLVGAPAVTTSRMAIGVAFFVGGATNMVWNVITVSLRQRVTPDRLLGRVNSGYRLVAWGTMPLGAAAGGVLAQLLGLRAVFAVSGLLTLSMLAVMTRVTDARMEEAEEAVAE